MLIVSRPATDIAEAVKTVQHYENSVFEEKSFKECFWGRGLVTTWYLSIEEHIMSEEKVDLSQLSEIKIAMRYNCFLGPGYSAEAQFKDISNKPA